MKRAERQRLDALHSAADFVKRAILRQWPKCMIAELWEGDIQTESVVFRHSGEVLVLTIRAQEQPK